MQALTSRLDGARVECDEKVTPWDDKSDGYIKYLTDRMLSAQMVLSWPDSDLGGRATMAQPKFAIFSVAASLFCKGAAQTCHQSTVAVNLSHNK